MKVSTVPLTDMFRVKARFCRSVNILADYRDPNSLADYILTPLARTVLRRVGSGLQPSSQGRAWSVTGPYGAGKSACALFTAKVLGYPINAGARTALQIADPELYQEMFEGIPGLAQGGFFLVLTVGSREPLPVAVLRGLSETLASTPPGSSGLDDLKGEIGELLSACQRGEILSSTTLTDTVERVAKAVVVGNDKVLGLLLILDELGKMLEYASLDPAHGDIFYLQSLAELASRSGGAPIGLVVILHQSFDRYAAKLSPIQQREWTKVQGRFENIGFIESSSELLKLIGSALEPSPSCDGYIDLALAEAERAKTLDLAPRDLGRAEINTILTQCAPLHPTVSLVVGRLFSSRLAQNERSLFAFLTSGEPHGLQEYLRSAAWDRDGYRPFYRLDQLYDYVHAALGSSLYSHSQGKRWAEIEDALDRLPRESTALEAKLVKTIGMLGLLGDQRYLKASTEVLEYALADGAEVSLEQVRIALANLDEWKIAIFRRHKDAYGLWEGSDIDLDERFQRGLDQIDRATSLATLLQDYGTVKPYVAKRHLHTTGTLRYFSPLIIGSDDLQKVVEEGPAPGDGAVVFVLAENGSSLENTIQAALATSGSLPEPRRKLTSFAIPRDTSGIREALEEVMAWTWVVENTPELEGDSIARKELAGRQIEAQNRLNLLCARSFDRAYSYSSAWWVWNGDRQAFHSAAELSAALSSACDAAYSAAPRVHNELVNRRGLSSAASAARRSLIERMFTRAKTERLGIEGFPPELSMYRSVLQRSGLHHLAAGQWRFGPSDPQDECKVRPLWQAIADFLTEEGHRRRSVSDLYALLRQPPFGIRDGILPIYLAAAMLHWDSEIALFENGSYVPKPDTAVFERLMKVPDQFSLQRYALGEVGAYALKQYSTIVGSGGSSVDTVSVLAAVQPLIGFVKQLPPYTQNTRGLSPAAMRVRDAVLSAREPHRLLLADLPVAVGMQPLEEADFVTTEAFFTVLRKTLVEIEGAYAGLLSKVAQQLFDALRLPADLAAARREIAARSQTVRERIADLRLKAFADRLRDSALSDSDWVGSVAAVVASKQPKQWNDQDLIRYGVALTDLAGQFHRVEEIVLDSGGGALAAPQEGRLMRLGLTMGSGEEQREIVRIAQSEEEEVQMAVAALDTVLRRLGTSKRVGLAAIAELTMQFLSGRPTEENRGVESVE